MCWRVKDDKYEAWPMAMLLIDTTTYQRVNHPLLSFEIKMASADVEKCRERDQPNLLHLLLPAACEDKKAVALDFGRHDSLRARFPVISVLRCFQ